MISFSSIIGSKRVFLQYIHYNANNIPTNPGKKNAHTLLPPLSSLDMDSPKQLNAQSINAIPPQMQSMKLRCASAQPFANYNRFT